MEEKESREKIEEQLQFSLETRKPTFGLNQTSLHSHIEILTEKIDTFTNNLKEEIGEIRRNYFNDLLEMIEKIKVIFASLAENQQHYITQHFELKQVIENLRIVALGTSVEMKEDKDDRIKNKSAKIGTILEKFEKELEKEYENLSKKETGKEGEILFTEQDMLTYMQQITAKFEENKRLMVRFY